MDLMKLRVDSFFVDSGMVILPLLVNILEASEVTSAQRILQSKSIAVIY